MIRSDCYSGNGIGHTSPGEHGRGLNLFTRSFGWFRTYPSCSGVFESILSAVHKEHTLLQFEINEEPAWKRQLIAESLQSCKSCEFELHYKMFPKPHLSICDLLLSSMSRLSIEDGRSKIQSPIISQNFRHGQILVKFMRRQPIVILLLLIFCPPT